MTEINGKLYSRDAFDGYLYRAKIECDLGEEYDYTCLDVYTTEYNAFDALFALKSVKSEKVKNIKIIKWSSKEDDEAVSKFIDDFLS